jgi:DNA-binding PadR family transcriptional regulator
MRRLEARSGGFWRPSPGSVDPTLQLLEDEGLVHAHDVEGRRVYELTEPGRAAATSRADRPGAPASGDDGVGQLRQSALGLNAAARQVAMAGTAPQQKAAAEIIAEARKRLYQLLAEE